MINNTHPNIHPCETAVDRPRRAEVQVKAHASVGIAVKDFPHFLPSLLHQKCGMFGNEEPVVQYVSQ